jgi:transcriptional regulator of acetoin/glycerol metabolism
VVSGGGRSITLDHHAQRLAREAVFLLVFGQTGAIKAAQLRRLYDGSHG